MGQKIPKMPEMIFMFQPLDFQRLSGFQTQMTLGGYWDGPNSKICMAYMASSGLPEVTSQTSIEVNMNIKS